MARSNHPTDQIRLNFAENDRGGNFLTVTVAAVSPSRPTRNRARYLIRQISRRTNGHSQSTLAKKERRRSFVGIALMGRRKVFADHHHDLRSSFYALRPYNNRSAPRTVFLGDGDVEMPPGDDLLIL